MPRTLESELRFLQYIQNADASSEDFTYGKKRADGSEDTEFVTQTVYIPNAEGTALVEFTAAERAASRNLGPQSFVRVFNVNKFFTESCAAVTLSPEQYLYLQKLGLTRRNDDALTAKVIGTIGHYRFNILRAQEQWGMRSTLMLAKERICQHTFKRLELLQTVERAHGVKIDSSKISAAYANRFNLYTGNDAFEERKKDQDPENDLIDALEVYKDQVYEELSGLIAEYGSNINLLAARKIDNKPLNYQDLKKTINQTISNKINDNPTKARELEGERIQLLALAKDYCAADKLLARLNFMRTANSNPYGNDEARNLVENFVKARIAHIIRKARYANEYHTIANGGFAYFRGSLNRALAEAEGINTTYRFDPTQAIRQEHQGIYSAEQLTVLSSRLTGTGRTALRDFLFGVNAALTPNHDPYAQSKPSLSSIFNHNHFSWLRKIWSARNETTINSYYQMRESAHEANIQWYKTILFDLREIFSTVYFWLFLTAKAVSANLIDLAWKLRNDFRWSEQAVPAATNETMLSPIDGEAAKIIEEIRHRIARKEWIQLSAQQKINELSKIFAETMGGSNTPALNAAEQDLLQTFRSIRLHQAPLAAPLYRLHSFNLDDPISQIMSGLESFYDFIAKYYEISPHIASYASLIYLLSAAAVIRPDLLEKVSASLKFINSWSIATAEAMSKSELSQVVSAAFTNFKIVLLALDAIADGGDSTLGNAAVYIKNHFAEVILASLAMIGAGYALSYGQIPLLSEHLQEDLGDVPILEQSFLAAKLIVVLHEAFVSEPGRPSTGAKSIKLLLEIALWPIRMFLIMPFNVVAKLTYESLVNINYVSTWENVLTPLTDALHFVKFGCLHLLDILLRIANLFGRGIKLVSKVACDVIFNGSATLMNRPLSLILAAAAVAACIFLFPNGGPISFVVAANTGALVGALLTMAASQLLGIKLSWSSPAKWLLTCKHRLYGIADHYLTRPPKQIYNAARNAIARIILREQTKLTPTYGLEGKKPEHFYLNEKPTALSPSDARQYLREHASSETATYEDQRDHQEEVIVIDGDSQIPMGVSLGHR